MTTLEERAFSVLPEDGSSMLEAEWRRKARLSMPRGVRMRSGARQCNRLLSLGVVVIRGEKSVARAGTLRTANRPGVE